MKSNLKIFKIDYSTDIISFPILTTKVKAGGYGIFESAALDFPEDTTDLNQIIKVKA